MTLDVMGKQKMNNEAFDLYRRVAVTYHAGREANVFKQRRISAASGRDDSLQLILRGLGMGNVTNEKSLVIRRCHEKAKNKMRREERE